MTGVYVSVLQCHLWPERLVAKPYIEAFFFHPKFSVVISGFRREVSENCALLGCYYESRSSQV